MRVQVDMHMRPLLASLKDFDDTPAVGDMIAVYDPEAEGGCLARVIEVHEKVVALEPNMTSWAYDS